MKSSKQHRYLAKFVFGSAIFNIVSAVLLMARPQTTLDTIIITNLGFGVVEILVAWYYYDPSLQTVPSIAPKTTVRSTRRRK